MEFSYYKSYFVATWCFVINNMYFLQSYPYQCTTCNRAFPRNYSLKRHLLLHIGDKKYKCDQCGHQFSHIYNRERLVFCSYLYNMQFSEIQFHGASFIYQNFFFKFCTNFMTMWDFPKNSLSFHIKTSRIIFWNFYKLYSW